MSIMENDYRGIPGIDPFFRGKVRDIYDLGDRFLIVSTDRISAYDNILPTPVPGKGIFLNMMSYAWFNFLSSTPNHMISIEVSDFPEPFSKFENELKGRAMLVTKAKRVNLECVVRGYLAGSGWREYSKDGSICGIKLPEGLRLSDKLPEPIFTPSTKAESGHDINISEEEAASMFDEDTVNKLKEMSLNIYSIASKYAESKGIIIADTKFEFGRIDDELVLIDEVLTPDSSRFWLMEEYEPGKEQKSLDKQFVRDYLDRIGWDHGPPAPELPMEIVEKTLERYRLAVDTLFPELNIERFVS